MVINKIVVLGALATSLLLVVGCSSDARFDQLQSARLAECKFKADKEYTECIEQQNKNYEKYKKQQAEQQ